jgi:hypothetical protein
MFELVKYEYLAQLGSGDKDPHNIIDVDHQYFKDT